MWFVYTLAICLAGAFADENLENKGIFGELHVNQKNYVKTENGIVKGHVVETEVFTYRAFLGIPYAAPPVGWNRFKAPLPPQPWHGVFEANRTVQCPQVGVGDEDCLVINVFTPLFTKRPLPVLVNIHGGAYFRGQGPTEGVEHLLKRDVIVVSFNYRIGTLGFLCLGTRDVPGNAGMKDQVAALRWVQRNIVSFGGDPRQVTIYGSSAGGASVDLQVLSAMSNGLFRGAIAESGAATSTWPIEINPVASAKKLAKNLGYNGYNIDDLTCFYQNVPANALTLANAAYQNDITDGSLGFAPCIEQRLPDIEPFMLESPYDILTQGNYKKIHTMLIYSSLEGLFVKSSQFYELDYKGRMEKNFEDFLPPDLIFESEEMKKEVAQEVKHFYFGNKTIDDDSKVAYLEYMSDFLIMHGVLKSAEYHSKYTNRPVYLMEFALKTGMGSHEEFYHDVNVAGHSDTSKHAFPRKPITNAGDQWAVDKVATIITNFVKYGNPTPGPSPQLHIFWPRVNPEKLNYLLFGQELTVDVRPHWRSKLFWDNLYAKYRRQLLPVQPELV